MAGAGASGEYPDPVLFRLTEEPNHKAFSLLLPKGWQLEGGITLTEHGLNADYSITSPDPSGVKLRWLPSVPYVDSAVAIRQWPILSPSVGSHVYGYSVQPRQSANEYIRNLAIPHLYPAFEKSLLTATDQRNIPNLTHYLQQNQKDPLQRRQTTLYDASIVSFSFEQDGRRYYEQILTVIEEYTGVHDGYWRNTETISVRAPEGQFDYWGPVLSVIMRSQEYDADWMAKVMQGAVLRDPVPDYHAIAKESISRQKDIAALVTEALFPGRRPDEPYLDPHDGGKKRGSGDWKYRWVGQTGSILYTDSDEYDPNTEPGLGQAEFLRARSTLQPSH